MLKLFIVLINTKFFKQLLNTNSFKIQTDYIPTITKDCILNYRITEVI